MFQFNKIQKIVALSAIFLLMAPLVAKSKPVIRVRNTVITQERIDSITAVMTKTQFANQQLSQTDLNQVKKQIASRLLGMELILLESKTQKLTVPKRKVDSLFSVLKGQMEASGGNYKQFLAMSGSSDKKIKKEIEQQLLMEKLLQKEFTNFERPTDEQMKKLFKEKQSQFKVTNEMRASQILLKAKKGKAAKKIKQLEKIKADVEKLQHLDEKVTYFGQMALKISEGPAAEKGGDLESFSKGDFFPAFDKAIASLKVGQVSKVFQSKMGVHLVMLTDKQDGTYENAKIRLFQYLVAQQTMEKQEQLMKYLKKLVKKYKVAYLDPLYKDVVSVDMKKQGAR